MAKVKDKDFWAMAEYLQGSCKILSSACKAHGFEEKDLSDSQLEDLDNYIIECPVCGWWVDAGDMTCDSVGNDMCYQCLEESEGL